MTVYVWFIIVYMSGYYRKKELRQYHIPEQRYMTLNQKIWVIKLISWGCFRLQDMCASRNFRNFKQALHAYFLQTLIAKKEIGAVRLFAALLEICYVCCLTLKFEIFVLDLRDWKWLFSITFYPL